MYTILGSECAICRYKQSMICISSIFRTRRYSECEVVNIRAFCTIYTVYEYYIMYMGAVVDYCRHRAKEPKSQRAKELKT